MKMEDLIVPKKIEEMNSYSLYQACKIITESYISLDYVNKPASFLDKIDSIDFVVYALISNAYSKAIFNSSLP